MIKITQETKKVVAKLFFERNVDINAIAMHSENMTIDNVALCIEDMQYEYYPVVIQRDYFNINKDITNTTDTAARNRYIGILYENGVKKVAIAREFKLTKSRIAEIIAKLQRRRLIHRTKTEIVDEPNLYINYMKQFVISNFSKEPNLNKLSENYDIDLNIILEWKNEYDKEILERLEEQKQNTRQTLRESAEREPIQSLRIKKMFLLTILNNRAGIGLLATLPENQQILRIANYYKVSTYAVLDFIKNGAGSDGINISYISKQLNIPYKTIREWINEFYKR